jgi:hypothetical protein
VRSGCARSTGWHWQAGERAAVRGCDQICDQPRRPQQTSAPLEHEQAQSWKRELHLQRQRTAVGCDVDVVGDLLEPLPVHDRGQLLRSGILRGTEVLPHRVAVAVVAVDPPVPHRPPPWRQPHHLQVDGRGRVVLGVLVVGVPSDEHRDAAVGGAAAGQHIHLLRQPGAEGGQVVHQGSNDRKTDSAGTGFLT